MTCHQFPLLELGSCHHKQYLVNLYFTKLPLGHEEEYKGLSQLSQVNLYVSEGHHRNYVACVLVGVECSNTFVIDPVPKESLSFFFFFFFFFFTDLA